MFVQILSVRFALPNTVRSAPMMTIMTDLTIRLPFAHLSLTVSFTSYPDDTHGAHFVATCGNRMFEFAKLTGKYHVTTDPRPMIILLGITLFTH